MPVRRALLWLLLLCPLWPTLVFSLVPLPAIYLQTDPVTSALWFALIYPVLLYGLSLVLDNCSIFDVHWSVLPPSLYVLHFAFHPMQDPDSWRRVLLIGLCWAWGMRLTFNWLLKGGLSFEDFRYLHFRKVLSPALFQLFSFVVLFLLQSAMVVAMCLPMAMAFSQKTPLGMVDLLALIVGGSGLLIETIADWQLRAFRIRRDAGELGQAGPRFCTEGLWRYSRHPNYFGEICVWWGVYLFSVAATGQWLNWTIVGPLTIHALFVGGSVQLTERHEVQRKPEYAEYQKLTSRIIPWPCRSAR